MTDHSSWGLVLGVLSEPAKLDLGQLVLNASLPVKGGMGVLVLMSLFSWYIIGYKYLLLSSATRETDRFLEAFWRSRDIEAIYKEAQGLQRSPLSHLFLAGYSELSKLQAGGPSQDREGD